MPLIPFLSDFLETIGLKEINFFLEGSAILYVSIAASVRENLAM
jgi:hypothetical protein